MDSNITQQLAYDRTHLANERTFAAWIRTGLAVAGGGLAVVHFLPSLRGASNTALLGTLFVAVGIGMIAFGAWRFIRVGRSLAQSSSTATPAPPVLVGLLALVLVLLLVAVVYFV